MIASETGKRKGVTVYARKSGARNSVSRFLIYPFGRTIMKMTSSSVRGVEGTPQRGSSASLYKKQRKSDTV
ncbi:hypothetical protein GYMLUDRAFT_649534 [Collybiopsis luxurians FD-317 M1]|nr:hypothetical protein GYMLUDRAFT_649534 [Collybiopsis luxurians FD-317 M1]